MVSLSNRTECQVLLSKDAANTFVIEDIAGTIANSYNLFGSGAVAVLVTGTVRVTEVLKQWYATSDEYSGDYFSYSVTGANPVALYRTIRFTPIVGLVALHPAYTLVTTYTVEFASTCSNIMIGDSSVAILPARAAPGIGLMTINSTSFTISTGSNLGDFAEFNGTNAAFVYRVAYAPYLSTGLPAPCFKAGAGAYIPGVSPTSNVGPFPTAGPLQPLFLIVPVGVSVESDQPEDTVYNLRLLIIPRYSMPTSISIVITYDEVRCPLKGEGLFFGEFSYIYDVATSRGSSPYTSCSKFPTGSNRSFGVKCLGSFDTATHGDIFLTISGLVIARTSTHFTNRLDGTCFTASIERMTAGYPDEDTRAMTGSFVIPSFLSVHQSTVFDHDANNNTGISMAVLLGAAHFSPLSSCEFVFDFPKTRFVPTDAWINLQRAIDNTPLLVMPSGGVVGSALNLSVLALSDVWCNVHSPSLLVDGCWFESTGTVSTTAYLRTDVLFDHTNIWVNNTVNGVNTNALAGFVPTRQLPLAAQRLSASLIYTGLDLDPASLGNAGITLVLRYITTFLTTAKHIITLPSTLSYFSTSMSGTGYDSFSCASNICTGQASVDTIFTITIAGIVVSTAPYELLRANIAIYDAVTVPGNISLSIAAYAAPELRAIEGYEPTDRLIAYRAVQSTVSFLGRISGPMPPYNEDYTVSVTGSGGSFNLTSRVSLAYTRILI